MNKYNEEDFKPIDWDKKGDEIKENLITFKNNIVDKFENWFSNDKDKKVKEKEKKKLDDQLIMFNNQIDLKTEDDKNMRI